MNRDKSDLALKTIGEVGKILDLKPTVIRFWLNNFTYLKPLKNRGRYYFSPNDINKLSQIKKLLYNDNYSVKAAVDHLRNKKNMESKNSKLDNNKRDKLIILKKRLIELRNKLLSFE